MVNTLLSRSLLAKTAFTACRTCTKSRSAQTSFTTSVIKAARPLSTSSTASRPNASAILPKTTFSQAARRSYASAAPTQPLAAPQPSSSSALPKGALTWDQFFATRSRRRYITMGVGAACAVFAAMFGSPLVGILELDETVGKATGVDPLVVIVGGSLAVAVGGWFVGRVLGGIAFSTYARSRGWQKIFAEKEKSFFARIKRYRADPTSSSPQNPIPDYYGEKISSVKDYRRWLKDQRAFTKKMYRGVR